MTIRVSWAPSIETDVVSYDLERADNLGGAPWVLITNIANDELGPNFDPASETFFYLDSTGTSVEFYRLTAIDVNTQRSQPSAPFRAESTTSPVPIKIFWPPSLDPNILAYTIERTADPNLGPWVGIVTIAHSLVGPNYDPVLGKFFYLDPTGDTTLYYHIIAVNTSHVPGPASSPFRATPQPSIPNRVKLDQNYTSPGYLRYQTTSGAPVENAVIRAFYKTDFDQGNTNAPLATTLTDVKGNWVNPIFVTTGFTYTLQFFKEGLYGPDKIEVVV